jgi:AraC-like DNA-binding protein
MVAIHPQLRQEGTRESREIMDRLRRSDIYPAYESAFQGTTGLPLSLHSVGSFHSPPEHAGIVNPFCRLLAGNNKSCAACLCLQQRVEDASAGGARTLECYAGLSESAVPIRVGQQVVAFLRTGQVLLRRPSAGHFRRSLRHLEELGVVVDRVELEKAYFATRVVSRSQYDSILRLLALIAEHLSSLSNQLTVQQAAGELPVIVQARAYIARHQTEEISLGEVAKAVNVSAFYFCKIFRKVTGLTFVNYLARLRVERVKELLLDPHKRISEAAFQAGFQSLSQFNRVFRRIEGQAPTAYRERLHPPAREAVRC